MSKKELYFFCNPNLIGLFDLVARIELVTDMVEFSLGFLKLDPYSLEISISPLLFRFFTSEGSLLKSEAKSSIESLHDFRGLTGLDSFDWLF